jgi:hypothetical protein
MDEWTMPLLSFWKNDRQAVLKLSIEQIVMNAGDGKLKDDSDCSQELRHFFKACPSDSLFGYARHCMEKAFQDSGLVLQDIVNELGRRLDFDVENGLYRGKTTAIGFDGIWRVEDEPALIIEVKTTDYVTIPLEKLASYKEKLIAADRASRDSSILILVGREDSGALEAQVRGSRYAWEMRLISIEGLIKLVQIKEKSDDPISLLQIRQLLRPFDYTKVDRIIDVIFTTAADVESQQATEQELSAEEGADRTARTEPELLNLKRQRAVDAFATMKAKELIKRSRTLYWTPDKEFRVCCAVSKKYDRDNQVYWYAYYPKWDDFLAEGKESYFILSCMDREEAFAVPFSWLLNNKQDFNITEKDGRSYWHVALTTLRADKLGINLSKKGGKTPLEPYRFKFKTS